ncbi:MAG TPA: carboxypeptidase regulatory-like domain-containing protein [Acidobacteriota bacterium]|nr:carboxypeptidase regulatory-like domain-containing protein [Acidobacteriota bacterium]
MNKWVIRSFFPMILLLVPALAFGQSFNATLNGSVVDPSGAVVAGAEVTLTNIAQQSEAKVITGEDGQFSFPNLKAGNYEIKVTAKGFKEYVQRGITLAINQIARQEIKLEIGEQAQTIEVSSNVVMLHSENAVREDSISPKTLAELPLLVSGGPRSSATFAILMPGVSTGATGAAYDARVNGGLTSGDEAIMDGVTMQEGFMSQNGMVSIFQDFPLTPDMVDEMKLVAANYEPQYGSTLSSAIVAVTKSGTSEFHGGGYEYHRNDSLNARQFGADVRPRDLENDYGFHLGGPVKPPGIKKIPGIYSDRSKAYFYINYEAFRIVGGVNRPTLTVPTDKMRNGDFSEWVDGSGNLIPIYDPATVRNNPNFDPDKPEGPTNSRYLKNQFMGCNGNTPNVICPTDPRLVNSLAKAWLKYVPTPNQPGIRNNYLSPIVVPDTILAQTNYWLVKGDYYFREKDHFAATVWYQGAPAKFVSVFPLQIASETFSAPQFSWVNRFNWDHTFSPSLLNHISYGYLNRNEGYGSVDKDYVNEFPKIAGVAKNDIPPTVGISGYAGYGATNGLGGLPNTTARPTNVVNDLLTWVRGKHTWKFGAEVRLIDGSVRSNDNNAGNFYFGENATGLPGFNSGNGYASFLLGAVDSANYNLRTIGSYYTRQRGYIWHVGDTWRLTSKLTLNLGIRWDYYTPSFEKYDRTAFFDPTGANSGAGGRPGRMVWAGNKWGPASYGARYPEKPWKNGFAPRVGFAYSVSNKTVVRAGYGIFYSQAFYPGWGGGIDPNGFNSTVNKSSVAFGGYQPAFYWQDGFPAPDASQIPPFIDTTKQNGKGYPTYRPVEANRLPYAQQWNLTIEHQLDKDTMLSVAYVVNKGTRLPSNNVPINVLDPKYLSMGAKLNDVFEPGMASLDGIAAPYAAWVDQLSAGECSPTVAQALLPYPQYCGKILGMNENAGSSIYHSFQAKVERRFSRGLFFLVSYTNSKLISDAADNTQKDIATWSGASGIISPYERQRNRSISPEDVPQVFSLAASYELPIGTGKRWMSGNKVANAIFGGFTFSTVFRASRGTPFVFRSGYCNIPGQFGMGCIPGILKNPMLQDPGSWDVSKPLFDRSAFEPVDSFNYYQGNGPRVANYREQGYHNQDFAIVKNLHFRENISLQLRAEMFNVWNWHILDQSIANAGYSVDMDINSSTFGMWNGAVTNPRNIQVGVRLGF